MDEKTEKHLSNRYKSLKRFCVGELLYRIRCLFLPCDMGVHMRSHVFGFLTEFLNHFLQDGFNMMKDLVTVKRRKQKSNLYFSPSNV